MRNLSIKKEKNETECMSFYEIAKKLNIPVHQVRIIYKKAIYKMKPNLRARGYNEEF